VLAGIREVITTEIRRGSVREGCRLFVAERASGALIGFLFAEIEAGPGPSGEPPPAWIHELWVEPAERKQGVAAQLLAESDAFFDRNGVRRVSVRVESSNADGIAFWSRRGFGERARILERIP
jgi:GNAT superfamily N-acetyltransferase